MLQDAGLSRPPYNSSVSALPAISPQVQKYAPRFYTELLSDDTTNRQARSCCVLCHNVKAALSRAISRESIKGEPKHLSMCAGAALAQGVGWRGARSAEAETSGREPRQQGEGRCDCGCGCWGCCCARGGRRAARERCARPGRFCGCPVSHGVRPIPLTERELRSGNMISNASSTPRYLQEDGGGADRTTTTSGRSRLP